MEINSTYSEFIKDKGVSLSLINPGSNEFALYFDDTMSALELLKIEKAIILGGDVLVDKNDELMYAYQQWGGEYAYLNWYFECNNNDLTQCYLESYNWTKEKLNEIKRIIDQFKAISLIVFVVKSS
ncbi:hypothetical protein ACKSBH_002577 [Acinetobacter baumannii]|uniref:hypothetical protein n=1 Tax=Acinetobacter baumannii TaxID=470 RepID=UPI0030BBA5EB